MAEAGGTNPSTTSPRTNFFCYTCNARFHRHDQNHDFTCPQCGGGFVEELPDDEFHSSSTDPAPIHDSAAALVSHILGGGGQAQQGGPSQFFDMLFGGFQGGPGSGRGTTVSTGSGGPTVQHTHTPTGISFTMTTRRGPGGNEQADPMDQMFQSFLSNLFVSLGGQAQPGANVFGNVGDYVWGRDGLDAIVTQLMNQMEGSGPPPLDKEKMERLKNIKIQQDQVNSNLDCKICWENFHLDEEVIQLDCDHVYHPECIHPWLKLHGTCPICRRDFTEGQDPSSGSNPPQPPSQDQDGFSSTSTMPPGSAASQPRSDSNPNRPRGYDMEMEFD